MLRQFFFFSWFLAPSKILTADKLAVQKKLAFCPFCDQEQETAVHLCLHRTFVQEVSMLVRNWVQPVPVPSVHSPTAAEIEWSFSAFHQHGV